jgi:hypothetical protein
MNSITIGVAASRVAAPTIVTAVVERPVTVSLVWSKALIYKFTTAGEEGNVETPPVSSVKSVFANVKSAPAIVPVDAVVVNLLPAMNGFVIGIYIHLLFPFTLVNAKKRKMEGRSN